jgi:hypothetical protein
MLPNEPLSRPIPHGLLLDTAEQVWRKAAADFAYYRRVMHPNMYWGWWCQDL